jgi:response regulator of citrate/malate metabolism
MEVLRTSDEIIFKLPKNIDTEGLQKIIDYLKYKEATADSQANQNDIDRLAEESKLNWWEENKHKYLNK